MKEEATMNRRTNHDDDRGLPEFAPAVDIFDQGEEIVLVADMPGVTAETLDIHLDRGVLTVRGRVAPPAMAGELVFQEYRVGDFVRTFNLTEDIEGDGISAELTDGVLTLRLPKTTERKPRRIPVKCG
jgi:HSP20 family protein